MVCGLSGGNVAVPIRVLASNPTGYAVRVETYYEVRRGRGGVGSETGRRGIGHWLRLLCRLSLVGVL